MSHNVCLGCGATVPRQDIDLHSKVHKIAEVWDAEWRR